MLQIVQKRKYFYAFSIAATVVSMVMIAVWGLNLGIDFKGGTEMEVRFAVDPVPTVTEVTEKLAPLELRSLSVQPTDNNSIFLRFLDSNDEVNIAVLSTLREIDPEATPLRTNFIGGSISGEIKQKAITGTLVSIVVVALFIAYAFRGISGRVTSYEYGLGAVIALAHDIIITIGVFAFLGHFYGVEVGIAFIAALLTILGYSVNDTIVVYDRIRENLIRSHKEPFEETVNRSLNETLVRSINTSVTVLITLLAMVLFGGESIRYFSLALFVGVAFGTYSSIFIASSLLVTRYDMKNKGKRV